MNVRSAGIVMTAHDRKKQPALTSDVIEMAVPASSIIMPMISLLHAFFACCRSSSPCSPDICDAPALISLVRCAVRRSTSWKTPSRM